MQTEIYSFICKKGLNLLNNHPANLSTSNQLIEVEKCPEYRLNYTHPHKERELALNYPPPEFDCTRFHWGHEGSLVLNIGSIYHEFNNPDIFSFLRRKASYIAFDPQGCFRMRDLEGNISYSEWFSPKIMSLVDCIKLSEREAYLLGFGRNLLDIITTLFQYNLKHILITQGSKGALLGVKKGNKNVNEFQIFSVPAFNKGEVIDETGAGDAFLYSFLSYLELFKDELDAIAFATSISSLMIEKRFEIRRYALYEVNLRKKEVLSGIKQQ